MYFICLINFLTASLPATRAKKMTRETIYEHNDVIIDSIRIDEYESKITCNGSTLIIILNETAELFAIELNNLMEKHRI